MQTYRLLQFCFPFCCMHVLCTTIYSVQLLSPVLSVRNILLLIDDENCYILFKYMYGMLSPLGNYMTKIEVVEMF